MSIKSAALMLAVIAFVAVPIVVSPTLFTLLKMGYYGWLAAFALGLPLIVAVLVFLLVRGLGVFAGLVRR